MKNVKTLLSETAAVHSTTADDVSECIRAYFDHLMEDSEFRKTWEQIPRDADIPDEEFLLALMIANAVG